MLVNGLEDRFIEVERRGNAEILTQPPTVVVKSTTVNSPARTVAQRLAEPMPVSLDQRHSNSSVVPDRGGMPVKVFRMRPLPSIFRPLTKSSASAAGTWISHTAGPAIVVTSGRG